ncbi:MAG: phosphatase PAP2 family protein [bacterium]
MFRSFLHKLPQTILDCFRDRNLLWHALAIALTYACVTSGFDWLYFEHTRSSLLFAATLPASILGFFVPIILPAALYLIGTLRKDARMQRAGTAVAQAGIIAWLVSSTYKAFTGRIQPYFTPYYSHLPTVDISHQFHFGFWQHGIFWGWPSSHAAVACAGMVALLLLYAEKKFLCIILLLYIVYIAFAVSVSIHWFSDSLAGAIIGTTIGVAVAKSFLKKKF